MMGVFFSYRFVCVYLFRDGYGFRLVLRVIFDHRFHILCVTGTLILLLYAYAQKEQMNMS